MSPQSEILPIRGRFTKRADMPLPLAAARHLFEHEMAAFLGRMDDVRAVSSPAGAESFLVEHHPIGGMNFHVTLVYALRTVSTERGLTLTAFAFDPAAIESRHLVIPGVVEGALAFTSLAADRTEVSLDFTLTIELPLLPALQLLPRFLVRSTADGIMSMKLGANVEGAYQKTLASVRALAQA